MTKILTIGSILFRMRVHYENLVHYLVHQSHERTRKTAHIYEAKMQLVQHFADIGEKRQTPPVDSPTLKAARSNRVGRTSKKALISLEKIRAFFLCVHILFFELGDCFGDYTQKNRLCGGIVQPCAKVFTNTEKRPPRWRPRPLEAVADLNHLDGGERSGYAYADPEGRLKHPVRLPCAGCESSCAVRPPLRPSPPAAWSAPPKSHQRPGLPRWRCAPRRVPGGCARRRFS